MLDVKKIFKNIICKLKNKRIIKIILFFKPSLIYLFRNKKINFTISNYYNNIKMNVSSDDLSIKTTYLSKNKDLIFVMEKYLKKIQLLSMLDLMSVLTQLLLLKL